MRRIISLVLVALALWGFSPAQAADFDDLFGDDLFTEPGTIESGVKPEEALLIQEGLEIGGQYSLGVDASRSYMKGALLEKRISAGIAGDLYLDLRPDPNFRIFGKMKWSGQIAGGSEPQLDGGLFELFADFNYRNKVFFRAGKQTAKWGVGLFFSPADVISVGRIDPGDAAADREGPIALKVHYPRGSSNYYSYFLLGEKAKLQDTAAAFKMEHVLGGTEISLGGFYQKGKAPRATATVSTSLGSLALFGEAVVSKGSDKQFLEMGQYVEKDGWFWHLTAGASYNYDDPNRLFNLAGAFQYYYDGEGTGFGNIILKPQDRHRLAAVISWNRLLNSKFSVMARLNSNLSDRSGVVMGVLSLPALGALVPSAGVSFNYGKAGTEFSPLGERVTTVFAAVTLGSGPF